MPCLSMIWRRRRILRWMWKMLSPMPWKACCTSFTRVGDVALFFLQIQTFQSHIGSRVLRQFQSSEVLKIGICSGKLDFMEFASMELASHLLAAADKYALPRLKVLRYMHNVSMLCRALSDSVWQTEQISYGRLPAKHVFLQGSLWRMPVRYCC